jgi:hypothetical protein
MVELRAFVVFSEERARKLFEHVKVGIDIRFEVLREKLFWREAHFLREDFHVFIAEARPDPPAAVPAFEAVYLRERLLVVLRDHLVETAPAEFRKVLHLLQDFLFFGPSAVQNSFVFGFHAFYFNLKTRQRE